MRKDPAARLFMGLFALGLFVAISGAAPRSGSQGVKFTRTELTIPTYLVGEPDRNPMFYFGRAYQGARGPVYPYAFLDNLTGRRADKVYTALYLENEYVRFCVLPEIGGRIFEAVDKTDGYNFFYRQHVIKPALIGMLGAWISGGVEWNIPHHHRATSFMPVDWAVSENPDGGRTIWIGETELRDRMRWSVGLTLRPGCSALEVSYRIYDGTPFSHSILCWTNAAVHANENYQVIFPPGVRLATFHGKNQFAHWPISHEVYNGVDYTRGVDVSWWKNNPRPTSFFAYDSDEDFLAGYDHGREAGVVFVGDHTVAPGKKLWTWGTGSEGARWEKILTDDDGPYLELMFGSFSDNQPDYSWIQPYELKCFKQTWYPIRGMGGVRAANAEAACRLELMPGSQAAIAFLTTSAYKGAIARLTIAGLDPARPGDPVPAPPVDIAGARPASTEGEKLIFEKRLDVGPDRPFCEEIPLPPVIKPEWLRLSLVTAEGRELIAYRPRPQAETSLPAPVTPPPDPEKIRTNEELYLAGLRLEQFHNPALAPEPYYFEALKRDPGDARANAALGRRFLLAGNFDLAEEHLRRAAGRLSANETRPKDTEPLFYLGVTLRFLGCGREAYEMFGRASWDAAWSAASWYEMAELAAGWGDEVRGLELLDRSLGADGRNAKAAALKMSLMRRAGKLTDAEALARAALSADPLDFRAANELVLILTALGKAAEAEDRANALRKAMRDAAQNYLEVAADYARSGLREDAADVLSRFAAANQSDVDPMVYYDLAFYSHKLGREEQARRYLEKARLAPPGFCFPFRLESIEVLRWAEAENPRDPRAPYYLGNLLFDRQPVSAIKEWEKSSGRDGALATLWRNLGIGYSRVNKDIPRAVACLERAVALSPDDARLYAELDELYDLAGEPAEKRLALLSKHHETVSRRDDSLSREIGLLIELGRYGRALELLASHHFHVWEGGGGVHDMFVDAHLLRGQVLLRRGRPARALDDFRAALAYPENLEVARPDAGGRDAEIDYWIGTALEAASDRSKAEEMFERSANCAAPPGELLYYQGLSCRKLGRVGESEAAFDRLVAWGRAGLEGQPAMDYFAKFGERESAERRQAEFRYVLGLGLLGRGRQAEARREFERALALYPRWARARRQLDRLIREQIS